MTLAQKEFQADYDKAVKVGNAPAGYGAVVDYYGVLDSYGGAALVIEFDGGLKLSPYYNQSAFDTEATDGPDIENDPHEWADNMAGATQWSEGSGISINPLAYGPLRHPQRPIGEWINAGMEEIMNEYINRIRNPRKKAYAKAYLQWLDNNAQGEEPDRDELSLMAAQAVRMELNDRHFMREHGPGTATLNINAFLGRKTL